MTVLGTFRLNLMYLLIGNTSKELGFKDQDTRRIQAVSGEIASDFPPLVIQQSYSLTDLVPADQFGD
ncbi:unnamed protein product [Rhodiola kirilowii]